MQSNHAPVHHHQRTVTTCTRTSSLTYSHQRQTPITRPCSSTHPIVVPYNVLCSAFHLLGDRSVSAFALSVFGWRHRGTQRICRQCSRDHRPLDALLAKGTGCRWWRESSMTNILRLFLHTLLASMQWCWQIAIRLPVENDQITISEISGTRISTYEITYTANKSLLKFMKNIITGSNITH